MPKKPVFIYALKCPRTGDVRYIGKTDDLKGRLKQHLTGSSKLKGHLGNWLRGLSEPPVLVVLHEVAETECWQEEERRYISCARAMGVDLVNSTDGGEGVSGPKSPEWRAALSAAKKGVPLSLEHCAAISAATKGVPKSPEHNAKNSAAHKGVPHSPEHCAAMSAARKGVPRGPFSPEWRAAMRGPKSPEHCAAISAAKTGVPRGPFSPEWRAAISAALTGLKRSPEQCAAMRGPKSPEHCAALSKAAKARWARHKAAKKTSPQ